MGHLARGCTDAVERALAAIFPFQLSVEQYARLGDRARRPFADQVPAAAASASGSLRQQRAASGAPTPKQPIATESPFARAHNSPVTNVTGELCTISLPGAVRHDHDGAVSVVDVDMVGVRAIDLTKSYGSVQAVRGIDLSIAPGETVALLGPNGAGKSTTIDMILGLSRPDRGSVSLFGAPPAAAVGSGWVSGMLQTGFPPDLLKVREFVTLVASYYPHPLRVDDVLRLTGAHELAGRWTKKLSGGQAQRARVAAALVGNPDLLVLDEPTTGIDVEGRREFWEVMRGVAAQGKTIIFATHYLEEADAFADRIVLIARGRIVADSPTTEIKAKAGSRSIRATLPHVDVESLRALPGVVAVERHGDAVVLSCSDADAALASLFANFPEVRDVEARGGTLEEAFLELTGEDDGRRTEEAGR